MEYRTIINESGFIISVCEQFKDGKVLTLELQEGQQAVEFYTGKFIKPRWNGNEWIEGAIDEEIQASKEENITKGKEPTEQETLNAQLLEEIAQQKIINAQLMQEIATLKGGTVNV